MESKSSAKVKEAERQAELRRQIVLLQSQLTDDVALPPSPKRRTPDPVVLAPATPSPKKKRKLTRDEPAKQAKALPLQPKKRAPPPPAHAPASTSHPPAPSTFISNLSAIKSTVKQEPDEVPRSSAFAEKPPMKNEDNTAADRDERLALVEELEPGPVEHTPPFDDPHFETLEPNSGIRLASRKLPHEDLQEYLTGRYYLSPSMLYSVIRLLPNKQGYDVPVYGDWVTIAVIAERGPIKMTTSGGTSNGKDSDDDVDGAPGSKRKKAEEDKPAKPRGKKYINLKLVDFGHRSRTSSTSKATIKGDALLTLLLFESDGFDRIKGDDGRDTKIYKGGSRGAFEDFGKLREGMVIALLNPKILKPFQKSGDKPHPVSNILALTPESAQSIAIIGQAKDLGMCTVTKRDGKVCGGWCDKRVSEVCEYHVQTAVQSRRAGRAEFSIGTSGMSSTAAKRKSEYDPRRQWGLKPENNLSGGTESTYVLSGHVVSAHGPEYIHESIGREGQAKAKRLQDAKETEKMLNALTNKDRSTDSAAAVVKRARIAANAKAVKAAKTVQDKKGKGKAVAEDLEPVDAEAEAEKRRRYSAALVKNLGFDPTLKAGQKRAVESKIPPHKLGNLLAPRREIRLGPPPGPRIRSVTAPQNSESTTARDRGDRTLAGDMEGPGSDSDEDLFIEGPELFGKPPLLLSGKTGTQPGRSSYDSDSELEITPSKEV